MLAIAIFENSIQRIERGLFKGLCSTGVLANEHFHKNGKNTPFIITTITAEKHVIL